MTPPTSARTRIRAWLKEYTNDPAPSDTTAVSYSDAPLYASDLQALVDAFDKPCGSCHPCENYADETWRAAGRKPPHVYEYDELKALVRHLHNDAPEVLARALRENGWQKTNHTLTWDNAYEATRRRHTHEARRLIAAVLPRSEADG